MTGSLLIAVVHIVNVVVKELQVISFPPWQIFVNNRLQQVIRNPQRTKALLPSLRLSSQLQLAIRAVGLLDSFSALSWAEYRPGQLSGSRQRGAHAGHSVTT